MRDTWCSSFCDIRNRNCFLAELDLFITFQIILLAAKKTSTSYLLTESDVFTKHILLLWISNESVWKQEIQRGLSVYLQSESFSSNQDGLHAVCLQSCHLWGLFDNGHPFSSIVDQRSVGAPSYWHICSLSSRHVHEREDDSEGNEKYTDGFIVLCLPCDGQWSVTKVCKYMSCSSFVSQIYSLMEKTFI